MRTALVGTVCALVVAACGSSSSKPTTSSTSAGAKASAVKISTGKVPKIGTVLVNDQGDTLYIFIPDDAKAVTCVAACADIWPPVVLPSGSRPIAGGLVKQSLLGSDSNSTGGRVVTYAGWPLYAYDSDSGPGEDNGQGINQNGGLWYVISPSGKVLKTAR